MNKERVVRVKPAALEVSSNLFSKQLLFLIGYLADPSPTLGH